MKQMSLAFKTSDVHIITREEFTIEKLIEIVELRSPTEIIDELPLHLNLILQSDYPNNVNHQSLKSITSTGSIHSESLRKKFSEVFPEKQLTISYGMTELREVSCTAPGEFKEKFSVGSNLFPNLSLKVVDASSHKLGVNEPGELVARDTTITPKHRRQQLTKMDFINQEILDTSTSAECCL